MKMSLTFRTKLAVGFGSVLLVAVVMGALGYAFTYRMSHEADQIASNTKKQNLAMEMQWSLSVQSDAVRGYLLTGDRAQAGKAEEADKHFNESADQVSTLLITPRGKQLLEQIRATHQRLAADYKQAIDLRSAGRNEEANHVAFGSELLNLSTQCSNAMEELDGLADQLLTQAIHGHDAAESEIRTVTVIVCVIGVGFGWVFAMFIDRSIAASMRELVGTLQAIERNDLAISDLEVRTNDDLGAAARALNSMKNSLRTVVMSLAGTAEELAAASEQIRSNAARAASGAADQQGQVQQVASTMAEMTATVHEISEGSNRAALSARQAADTARDGGNIVENALEQMRGIADAVRHTSTQVVELGDRSEKIGHIIAVIDEIAEQTNLLALNAAIEAARAGEQGRGFAVVAGEVRRLAERTAKATSEINDMIKGVQAETRTVVETMQQGTEQVERGVAVTTNAGTSLEEIIKQAQVVGDMIGQIATAATEQSAATAEVSSSISEINRLATGNSGEAQEVAETCEHLSRVAQEIRELVQRFRLSEGTSREEERNRREPGARKTARRTGVA